MKPYISIACFISSHGFGHAARASAVINALFEQWPFLQVALFTTVPEWFFKDSLQAPFSYHHMADDTGLVQRTALEVDLTASVARLDKTFPLPDRETGFLAGMLKNMKCRLVISDISPWGIVAAGKAGVPSLLIENFTWDWIYGGYLDQDIRLKPHIGYLRHVFAAVDHHIQALPWCSPCPAACLETPPISRKALTERAVVRDRLGLGAGRKMVLITMGGIPEKPGFIEALKTVDEPVAFVVPGNFPDMPINGQRRGNVTLLPHHSAFYHPDLVRAADAVVGKVGYSTLAEAYHSGVPFGYVSRPGFREGPPLEAFIQREMVGLAITPEEFATGAWIQKLPELLALPKRAEKKENGADVAAAYIRRLITTHYDLLEVVDGKGNTCGAAPRREVHGNNQLCHRVVHVLVLDDQDRMLLQKRSMNKRVAPGKWDTSVGGHVDCGETIETAMLREMAEELGITGAAPEFAYQYIHSNDFESERVFTFVCRFNGRPRFNPEEIETVAFWDMKDIEAHLGKGLFSDNFEHEYCLFRQWSDK
jgi:isopentenyldiphosphate isomerase